MSTLACGVINDAYNRGIVSTVNTLGTRGVAKVTYIDVAGTHEPISGDPRVLGYKYGTTNCAMVAAYTYTTLGTPGAARVALFGIDSSGNWTQLVQKLSADWGFSNPYGLVVIGSNLYVQDYDSGAITIVNLSTYATSPLYTMPSVTDGGTTYLPHGNGLDYHASYGLVAIYSFLPSANYTNYYASKLAIVPVSGTPTVVSGLNNNVVSVAVNSHYAYVTSIGGAQQAGGNSASKIETVDLSTHVLGTTPVTATTTPVTTGDFVDVAFWNSAAYVLRANYNTGYSQYSYQLIKTTGGRLQQGNFGTLGTDYTTTGLKTATPADATWMLAPAVDALWFVSGSAANIVASGTLSSTSVTKKADASDSGSSDYGLGTTVGDVSVTAHLNTASVVINIADQAARDADADAGADAAVAATRTKVAFKFVRPEELEEQAKAQIAAAKQE